MITYGNSLLLIDECETPDEAKEFGMWDFLVEGDFDRLGAAIRADAVKMKRHHYYVFNHGGTVGWLVWRAKKQATITQSVLP